MGAKYKQRKERRKKTERKGRKKPRLFWEVASKARAESTKARGTPAEEEAVLKKKFIARPAASDRAVLELLRARRPPDESFPASRQPPSRSTTAKKNRRDAVAGGLFAARLKSSNAK